MHYLFLILAFVFIGSAPLEGMNNPKFIETDIGKIEVENFKNFEKCFKKKISKSSNKDSSEEDVWEFIHEKDEEVDIRKGNTVYKYRLPDNLKKSYFKHVNSNIWAPIDPNGIQYKFDYIGKLINGSIDLYQIKEDDRNSPQQKKKQKISGDFSNQLQQNNEKPGDEITITYYNVGQGNCVLMENITEKQAVLVDCGTSEWGATNGRPTVEKHPTVDLGDVVKKIREKMKKVNNPFVIISHNDSDHYNLIPAIFKDNSIKKPTVIMGVESTEFKTSKTPPKITNITPYPKIGDWLGNGSGKIEVVTEGEPIKRLNQLQKLLSSYKWIKPIVALKDTEDSNASSIVLKAVSGKCSALLPGDATGKTESAIKKEDRETTVLLASHHGADTDKSNGETWVQDTNPLAIVISAGYHGNDGHPRCGTIENYVKNTKTLGVRKHPLTCGLHEFVSAQNYKEVFGQNFLQAYEGKFNGTEAIFNTFNQGTITVEFTGDDKFTLRADKQVEVNNPFINSAACGEK